MKIALLAPIEETVPPKKYGGTETVVHTLAEELHRRGHDVTVFASGDSKLSCRVVPLTPFAIGSGISKRLREALTYEAISTLLCHLSREKFDILHNNIGFQPLLFRDAMDVPLLSTIHFTLDKLTWPTEHKMHMRHKDLPFVSISNNQRRNAPSLHYVETIYHGLNLNRFTFSDTTKGYLTFFGRLSPFKGPLEAIKVAQATGRRLVLAGKINTFEQAFFDKKIKPHIDGKNIIFLGELDHAAKVDLLQHADALLSPISWDEPFGLTTIEAMACGTPVLGFARGSFPEIIKEGVTGFLSKNVRQMVSHVKKLDTIKRLDCREHVEKLFSAERMTNDYLKLYDRIIKEYKSKHVGAAVLAGK